MKFVKHINISILEHIMIFTENEILQTINLTNHQQQLLSQLQATSPVPGSDERKLNITDQRMATAKDLLEKLGLIEINRETEFVKITPAGENIMKQDGLLDEYGDLTEKGNSLAFPPAINPPAQNLIPPETGMSIPVSNESKMSFSQYFLAEKLVQEL
jgi:hypothetical protein